MTAAQAASQFHLALLGADDPLGESFLKALEETEIHVGRLHPLVLGEPEGIVAFRGEEWPCLSAGSFDFGQTQVLVLASAHPAARQLAEQVRGRNPAMPMLSLQDVVPGPAVAVARILKVLAAVGGDVSADAFVTLPAALAGKAGLDELISQSRGLFNMESPDPEAFPLQIAFNVIPLQDEAPGRYSPQVLKTTVAALAPMQDLGFSVAWAPLLFGASTALHVRLGRPVEPAELREALGRQAGICLMESDLPAGNPTPATDSAESADIFLGQVQMSGKSVRIWLVYDPLRIEAEQMVAAVENWIEKPANSVLT